MRPCIPHAGNWPEHGNVRDLRPDSQRTAGSPQLAGGRYTLITVSGARTSLSGWLARMGFTDVPRAERELAALGITSEGHPLLALALRPPTRISPWRAWRRSPSGTPA